MSDRTECVHVPQAETTGTVPTLPTMTPGLQAAADSVLSRMPGWSEQSPALQDALRRDYSWAVVKEGLPESEYLEGLVEWLEGGNSVEEYLAESGLAPEQEQEEQAAEQPGVAQAAEEAAATAEREREAAIDVADKTLREAVKAFRKGEKEYRVGLLEAGRLAGEYICQRMALGDARKAAVDTVKGDLSRYASSPVDVNRLVLTYHAYRLLAEEPGLATQPAKGKPAPADAVSYGHYRDAYARLVERTDKDTATERYILLPGFEEQCKSLYADSTANGLSKDAVEVKVTGTLRNYADKQAAEKQAAAALAKRDADEKRAVELAALKAAKELEKQAEQLATVATEQGTDQAKDAAAQALAALQQQQATAKAASAAATLAAQKAAQQLAEEREATKRQVEAEARQKDKDAKRAEREARKANGEATVAPPTPTANQGTNLLASARQGTVKDVAGMAVELVTGGDEPDDVLHELLRQLDGHKELSKASQRAVKAALVVLANRTPSVSPAQLAVAIAPPNNGPLVATAS